MLQGALRTASLPSSGFASALGSLTWELAVPAGLHPGQGSAFWHAGHVSAVVPSGARDLLIGSHSGGVWQLQPDPADATRWGALPLSDDWDNPNISTLVVESGDHVYAGCFALPQTAVRLYEALPGTGGTAWQPVSTILPTGVDLGDVYALACTKGQLVCAASSGLWFTAIPPERTPAGSRRYRWTEATWPAGQNPGGISGLAIAADGSVVASSLAGGTIWTGQFRTSPLRDPLRPTPLISLVMSQSSTLDVATPSRSSLAGCAADPQRMYAVIAHTFTATNDNMDGTIAAVWTSADGGRTWASVAGTVTSHNGAAISPVSLLDTRDGGGQGATWNNCIAVSLTDPATVVIGWEIGMFVSRNATATDGSASWNRLNNPTADSPLHFDYHALVFEPRPTAPARLYVGSDGGLISTEDLGQTYLDGYNAALTDLQFESLPDAGRGHYGLTSASPTVPGLLAGGLQDNGVVWAMAGAAGHWEATVSGDGAATAFLADGSLLSCSLGDGDGNAVHLWQWDGAQFTGDVKVPRFGPFGLERPTDPAGLQDPALAAVPPTYQHGDQTLCAVGGNGQEPNVVWGLFRNQDGSAPQWERLAELQADHALWSFASGDGTTIYVGVQQGLAGGQTRTYVHRIDLTVSPPGVTQLPDPPPLVDGRDDSNDSPMITRLAVHPSGTLLACYNTGTGGQLLAFDAGWSRLTGTGIVPQQNHIYALDVDDFGGIYIATDDSIYFSAAIGATWSPASAGLPKRPHPSHLCFARTPAADGIGLYLSTFGRSAWQAHWPVPALPQGSQLGWGWNELIGNLADGTLVQLGPGGLQPIPGPGDPATQLATRYQELFTVLGDIADRIRLAIAAPAADVAEQLIVNQVHARVDRLCQAAAVLTEASGLGATASVVIARRVGEASQHITQAAAALTRAVSELPASMSGAGLAQAAAALADHITAMNTLAADIARRQPS